MKTWHLTANDSFGWYEFCLSFMMHEMTVQWRVVNAEEKIVCSMTIDPYEPVDSTGSMPSFIDQAKSKGFTPNVWITDGPLHGSQETEP